MGLYLYCIGDRSLPGPPGDLRGVQGAAVRAADVSGFRVWLSDLDRAPPASLDRVRDHNAVVEASTGTVTPLPMRYGQFFADPSALEGALADRRSRLEHALEQVRDALEFGVRVIDPEQTSEVKPDRSSGTAYLEALAQRERRAEAASRRGDAVATELEEWLGDLVRASRVRTGGRESLVAVAHLVGRHDTGTYTRRIEAFVPRHTDLRLVTTGPWPPYGFVDEDDER